jgi:hypothetical protein
MFQKSVYGVAWLEYTLDADFATKGSGQLPLHGMTNDDLV